VDRSPGVARCLLSGVVRSGVWMRQRNQGLESGFASQKVALGSTWEADSENCACACAHVPAPLPAALVSRGIGRLLCCARPQRPALAYVYFVEEEPGRRSAARLLTRDEPPRHQYQRP
jgi:hypothetical protein